MQATIILTHRRCYVISFWNGLMAPEKESLNLEDITDCMLVETTSGKRFLKLTAVTGRRYLVHEQNNSNFDSIRIKIENREE